VNDEFQIKAYGYRLRSKINFIIDMWNWIQACFVAVIPIGAEF